MAKKNSTKTATEKSIQASEPRVQVFTGWQGINIKDAPLGWYPVEQGFHDHRQTDLKPNYLVIQNNLVTEDTMTIQTRPDAKCLAVAPDGYKFTGVSYIHDKWIFLVARKSTEPSDYTTNKFRERIFWSVLPDFDQWNKTITWTSEVIANYPTIRLYDAEHGGEPLDYEIMEIGVFEKTFIVTTRHEDDVTNKKYVGEIFTADFKETYQTKVSYEDGITRDPKSVKIGCTHDDVFYERVESASKIANPHTPATLAVKGMQSWSDFNQNATSRIEVVYAYTNKFGYTLANNEATIYTEYDPAEWSSEKYLKISGTIPISWDEDVVKTITGVDVYASTDDKQTKAFIGHVDLNDPEPGDTWKMNWLGSMEDIADWMNSSLSLPEENTTKGVPAAHFAIHDSRLYFWGNPNMMHRLYIGGNPGNELSVARGYGGAFIDIEPGTGIEIMGTAKWKTASGANIVTMMCGNPNTNMVKRFNIVETNLVTTNEVSSKGYMYEEVSNVIGCNSRWGYGVYDDGLYSVSRYGLMLTTMAMEYNNQMKNQNVSEVIKPVFTDLPGNKLKNCRMVCIDSVIYISLSQKDGDLDQVILVYDIEKKAWYTFTHDQYPRQNHTETVGNTKKYPEAIRHLIAIDSDQSVEGLGVITDGQVWLYPTAGRQQAEDSPTFNVLMETGELAVRQPLQQFFYLHQLEFRFDYFIGHAVVYVEGTDYYGRPFRIYKELNKQNDSGLMREYIEYIHVGLLIQSYRIRMVGQLRCRLVSINAKLYTHANRIGTPYGYDDLSSYKNRHNDINIEHHYIRDYNNLRDAIVT